MWRFNYVPWTIDYADKCVQNEMALDEGALRAQIAELDQKIAFYEADIERSEEQSVELLADVQTLAMRLKELKTGIMEIQRKEPKLQLLLDKMQDKTNECSDEMAEVIKSVQDAQQLAATADNVAQKTRLKELKEAIEARKKMMQETGYGTGDGKRLKAKLEVARARYAELQAKVAEKQQLEMKPERCADDSAKGGQKKPTKKSTKKAPKKERKQSKGSSSRRRKSPRK